MSVGASGHEGWVWVGSGCVSRAGGCVKGVAVGLSGTRVPQLAIWWACMFVL